MDAMASSRPNVLYGVAHDLRADCDTPNLRRLLASADGVAFSRAFCQAPYCTPSRASWFTGRRPSVTDIHTFEQNTPPVLPNPSNDNEVNYDRLLNLKYFDELEGHSAQDSVLAARRAVAAHAPIRTAVARAFADAGYTTHGAGITLMGGKHEQHCPACWTDGYQHVSWYDSLNGLVRNDRSNCGNGRRACTTTFEHSHDASVAAVGVAWIRGWRQQQRAQQQQKPPFFLMLGFWGGHMDYATEQAYYDEYGSNALHLESGWARTDAPQATSRFTRPGPGALSDGEPTPRRVLAKWEEWRRGYRAAEAKLDRAWGELLDELEAPPSLAGGTIVVFHGDHGLSGGEYGSSGKGKLLDVDTRVPLWMRAPGTAAGPNRRLQTPVELLDVFPTLCDLARIPCPRRVEWDSADASATDAAGAAAAGYRGIDGIAVQPTAFAEAPLDGRSLLPLLLDDDAATEAAAARWAERAVAHSQPRCLQANEAGKALQRGDDAKTHWACLSVHIDGIEWMGTSVRSPRHRFVVWAPWDSVALQPRLAPNPETHAAGGFVELYEFSGDEYRRDGGRWLRATSGSRDLGYESINLVPPGVAWWRLPTEVTDTCERLHALALAYWRREPPSRAVAMAASSPPPPHPPPLPAADATAVVQSPSPPPPPPAADATAVVQSPAVSCKSWCMTSTAKAKQSWANVCAFEGCSGCSPCPHPHRPPPPLLPSPSLPPPWWSWHRPSPPPAEPSPPPSLPPWYLQVQEAWVLPPPPPPPPLPSPRQPSPLSPPPLPPAPDPPDPPEFPDESEEDQRFAAPHTGADSVTGGASHNDVSSTTAAKALHTRSPSSVNVLGLVLVLGVALVLAACITCICRCTYTCLRRDHPKEGPQRISPARGLQHLPGRSKGRGRPMKLPQSESLSTTKQGRLRARLRRLRKEEAEEDVEEESEDEYEEVELEENGGGAVEEQEEKHTEEEGWEEAGEAAEEAGVETGEETGEENDEEAKEEELVEDEEKAGQVVLLVEHDGQAQTNGEKRAVMHATSRVCWAELGGELPREEETVAEVKVVRGVRASEPVVIDDDDDDELGRQGRRRRRSSSRRGRRGPRYALQQDTGSHDEPGNWI